MNQQERIIKYLNRKMDAAEQIRFEAEMATNSDLSDAVDLQRDITSFFKNRAPALEAILEEEGAAHFKEISGKNDCSKWKSLLLLVLPIGLILWSQSTKRILITSQTSPSILEKPTIDNDSPFIEDTISPVPPSLEEDLPKESLDKQQDNTTKSNNKREVIASANPISFQRNPVIESIMAEQVRATASITTLKTPVNDTTFLFRQNIPFKVAGTTNIAPPYTLSIYSNRVFDFENNYKVLSSSLSGTQLSENYSFTFNANIPFPKGLYYLLLESEQEGEILHVSRFKVE